MERPSTTHRNAYESKRTLSLWYMRPDCLTEQDQKVCGVDSGPLGMFSDDVQSVAEVNRQLAEQPMNYV